MDSGNWLTYEQEGAFRDALLPAFSLNNLDDLMRYRLGKPRDDYALGDDRKRIYSLVVNAANVGNWAEKLLAAALAENPDSRPLLTFARKVGYSTTPAGPALEKVVDTESDFQDFFTFASALATIETAVCQIAVPGGGGTGTLVGPDLVLTNHHVIEALRSEAGTSDRVAQTRCIFDFKRLGKTGRFIDPGIEVALADDWLVESRPPSERDIRPELGDPAPDELDFALLRLARDVGNAPVGSGQATLSAKMRGWINIAGPAAPPAPGEPLFIAQHPQLPGTPRQEPLLVAWGRTLETRPGRLRHAVSTEHGSSGSLCFDAQLRPVALHHLGDPNSDPANKPTYNQAILLKPIVDLLTGNNVQLPAWTGNS